MLKTISSNSGTYQIVSTLKNNESKQVYKAHRKDKSTDLKMPVLLKIFNKQDPSYKWELESLLKSKSTYCVRLLGFETLGKKRALILEYIDGISLSQLIESFHLSNEEIDYILVNIFKGLVDLKKQGLCHGDLSLDNILIDRVGKIKFIDFGKANYQETAQGTFPFVAPEILEGQKAGFVCDLFSLGVIEVFLRNPHKNTDLKQMSPKDFVDESSALLSNDPQNRVFCLHLDLHKPSSLCHKVKNLLTCLESKRCETEEIPIKKKASQDSKLSLFKVVTLVFFGFYVGASSFSTIEKETKGILKVSTNQWFLIHLKNFKSYAPVNFYISPGWHVLNWKTADSEGKKLIHIKAGKTLLLKDKNFLNKNNKVF